MSTASIRRQRLCEVRVAVEALRNANGYRARDAALASIGLAAVLAQVEGVALADVRRTVGSYWALIAFPSSLKAVA